MQHVPVIIVADLYHPRQDISAAFDLVAAYALPEIDLRAVILDCAEPSGQPVSDPQPKTAISQDTSESRDAGVIRITQLNEIFDRAIPYGIGPFSPMASPFDPMTDVPRFQQHGIELILETLQASRAPVHLLSFGSARTIAAAYNRRPDVFTRNGAIIEISAGASSPPLMELNAALDPNAIVRLLDSPLSINIYPRASENGPFDAGRHNTYFALPSLEFVHEMEPRLRRYLKFAIGREGHLDSLRAMDADADAPEADAVIAAPHRVWTTAVWMEVGDRRLVRAAIPGSRWRLALKSEFIKDHEALSQSLLPCTVLVNDDGTYRFDIIEGLLQGTISKRIYYRDDPSAHQAALGEALPDLYRSFRPAEP